jgi:hypothetical protein
MTNYKIRGVFCFFVLLKGAVGVLEFERSPVQRHDHVVQGRSAAAVKWQGDDSGPGQGADGRPRAEGGRRHVPVSDQDGRRQRPGHC